MKVLITGAKGFVGKNLTEALKNVRDGKDKTRGELKITELFLYDLDSTESELENYCKNADFVFNLAGVNRPENDEDFMKGNFGFASTLLNTLKKYGNKCPVMLSSSVQASLEGRYRGSKYGESKKAGENLFFDYAKETGAKVLVYRFPNLFGKWCRPNYNSAIATFCHNTANGLEIKVNDPNAYMDVCYIDDLTDEMINALSGKENRSGSYCSVPVHYETTLGVIADAIKSFPAMRLKLGVPDMSDGLKRKLYATWLSYLPSEEFAYNLRTNEDARGSFTEIIRSVAGGQFSVNVSKPGAVKGNHWHNTKNEKFVVVSGEGLIKLRKIGLDENGNKYPVYEFKVSGEDIRVVDMIPGYTHSIKNLSRDKDLVTFMWADECFDPSKPDTFYEEV